MKFARSMFVRVSIIPLALAAGPVTSSATQVEVLGTIPAAVTQQLQAAVALPTPSVAMIARDQLIAEAADLNAGHYVWHPELAPAGAVEIVVSLPQQRAYIYRANTLIGITTVSTGRPGHRTPTGTFPIIEKHRTHFSSIYDAAPMPFMQRLTMGGIALHAGQIPNYPASHGCVRLPYAMAQNLFGVTQVRSVVHIVNAAPTALTALQVARGERPAMPTEEPVRGTR
jgi:hypothetical protein